MRKEIIGNAELWHGDCREIEFPKVDMIFTDPPYGHNNNNGDLIHNWEAALGRGKRGDSIPILNDSYEEATELVKWLFIMSRELLIPGGLCCCCCGGGGGPDPQFARWSLWMDEVLEFKQMIVWDKGPIGMGWHYRRSYETILVGMKKGAACKWYDETDQIENIIRPGYKGIKKIIPQQTDHPTPKPVKLAEHFISLHSAPGDLVCDPFMGAGTTGVACINLGRKFIGCELDHKYFNIACERISHAQKQLKLFEGSTIQDNPVLRQPDLI